MSILRDTSCCGVDEIEALERTAKESLLEICEEKYGWGASQQAFILFTDIASSTRGKNLSKYITEKKLGDVIKTAPKTNPNSGNRVTVWVWAINEKSLLAWWNKNKPSNDWDDDDSNEGYD